MASNHESGFTRRRILECTLLVVILVTPRVSAGNDARAREDTFAQYCIPEGDVPGAQTIYCRA